VNPAPSVILFTVASGAGFGMLAMLGAGIPSPTGWAAFWLFGLAYLLAVGGLAASTFHLANPKNAVKAFSQWQSSWLSREAILAVAALLVSAVNAFSLVFFETELPVFGWVGSLLSIATVLSTGMIYAQLRAVPRWNSPLTPALFLAASLSAGALLTGQPIFAVFGLLIYAALQLAVWVHGDEAFATSGSTSATATGIDAEHVSLFEAPHTGSNYLLKEMVFWIGRKHASRLRVIALSAAIAIPLSVLFISTSLPALFLAGIVHLGGMVVARWLFFAEAEHVVGLYYGRNA
jgi:DMSO reductase anchor subunit